MEGVAQLLRRRRDVLVSRFEASVRGSGIGRKLSRSEIADDVPEFLDAIEEALALQPTS